MSEIDNVIIEKLTLSILQYVDDHNADNTMLAYSEQRHLSLYASVMFHGRFGAP